MHRLMPLALFAPLARITPGAQSADLVQSPMLELHIKDAQAENGKVLNMDFSETAHTDENSTVLVARKSGGLP